MSGMPLLHYQGSAQQTFKDEFIDMMRWEHLMRTQPIYLSPEQWEKQCAEFVGAPWKAKCAEYLKDAIDGEREAVLLVERYKLNDQVRRIGTVSLYLPVGMKERETHDEFTVTWMQAFGKLISGFRSEETNKCMHDYACTVRILFDRSASKVRGVEVLQHR